MYGPKLIHQDMNGRLNRLCYYLPQRICVAPGTYSRQEKGVGPQILVGKLPFVRVEGYSPEILAGELPCLLVLSVVLLGAGTMYGSKLIHQYINGRLNRPCYLPKPTFEPTFWGELPILRVQFLSGPGAFFGLSPRPARNAAALRQPQHKRQGGAPRRSSGFERRCRCPSKRMRE